MTVDRPYVGGGVLKETGMACPRCVWGRGPHIDCCVMFERFPVTTALDNIDALLEEAKKEEEA